MSGRSRRCFTPGGMRRNGLILLFVGLALTVGLWGSGAAGNGAFWWGLLPAAIGLAYLLSAFFETRDLRQPGEPPRQGGFPSDSVPR